MGIFIANPMAITNEYQQDEGNGVHVGFDPPCSPLPVECSLGSSQGCLLALGNRHFDDAPVPVVVELVVGEWAVWITLREPSLSRRRMWFMPLSGRGRISMNTTAG